MAWVYCKKLGLFCVAYFIFTTFSACPYQNLFARWGHGVLYGSYLKPLEVTTFSCQSKVCLPQVSRKQLHYYWRLPYHLFLHRDIEYVAPTEYQVVSFQVDRVRRAEPGEGKIRITAYHRTNGKVRVLDISHFTAVSTDRTRNWNFCSSVSSLSSPWTIKENLWRFQYIHWVSRYILLLPTPLFFHTDCSNSLQPYDMQHDICQK